MVRSSSRRVRSWSLIAAGAMLVLAVGASVSSATSTSESASLQAAKKKAAIAAARKDAKRRVAAPTGKKIGYIHLSAQSTSSQRMLAATRAVARKFGFSVVVCDPNFDPQRIQQCATSLVAQNVNIVLSVATEPGLLGGGFTEAAKRKIPWINISGAVSPNKNMLPYNPDQVQLTRYYDNWLFNTMKRRTSGTATLMSIGAPAVGLAARISETTRLAQVRTDRRVNEVVTHSLDLANAVQDTLNTMNQTLDRYPNLTGTWTICDFCVPLMAQAATSKGATGDKRPVISGMFTTPQTIAGIRNGSVDGVVELPYEVSSYVALDQALQFWARKKPFYRTQKVFTEAYSLKFLQPYMLTKANVGARGNPRLQGPDFVTYFNTKWRLEFGK